jgi:hypothetical protein
LLRFLRQNKNGYWTQEQRYQATATRHIQQIQSVKQRAEEIEYNVRQLMCNLGVKNPTTATTATTVSNTTLETTTIKASNGTHHPSWGNKPMTNVSDAANPNQPNYQQSPIGSFHHHDRNKHSWSQSNWLDTPPLSFYHGQFTDRTWSLSNLSSSTSLALDEDEVVFEDPDLMEPIDHDYDSFDDEI